MSDGTGPIFVQGMAKLYFAPGSDATHCWFYSYDPKTDARRHGERVREQCIRVVESLQGYHRNDQTGEVFASTCQAVVDALRTMKIHEE